MTSENFALDTPLPDTRTLVHRRRLRILPSPHFVQADEAVPPRMLLQSILLPEETLLRTGQISNGIYWKSFAMLVFSVVFIAVMLVFGLPMQLTLFLIFVLAVKVIVMFVMAYMTQYYLLLAVTDKRVITRFGVFNLGVAQLSYAQIESSDVASTIPGRFFGYSSLFVSGTGGHSLVVPYVSNAEELRRMITDIVLRRDEALVSPVVTVAPAAEETPGSSMIILDPAYV